MTGHSGQLSFLPSTGRETSTRQRAVMLCDWEVEADNGLIPFVN